MAAEMAKKRIEELKEQEHNKHKESMMLKHQNERLEIEEAHLQEYDNFNQMWDQKQKEFQDHAVQLIGSMEERHVKELEDNRADLEQRLPIKYKPSSEILNLQKIQDNLAKQKQYAEAHQVQQRVE